MRVDAIVKQRHNLHKRKPINSRRRHRKICTSQLSPCQWPILILFLFIISLFEPLCPLFWGLGPQKTSPFLYSKLTGHPFGTVQYFSSSRLESKKISPSSSSCRNCQFLSPHVTIPRRRFSGPFFLRLSELISVLKRIRGFPIYVNDQIYKINGKGHSSSQQLKLRKLLKLRVVLPMWANTVGTNAVHGSGSAMWSSSVNSQSSWLM